MHLDRAGLDAAGVLALGSSFIRLAADCGANACCLLSVLAATSLFSLASVPDVSTSISAAAKHETYMCSLGTSNVLVKLLQNYTVQQAIQIMLQGSLKPNLNSGLPGPDIDAANTLPSCHLCPFSFATAPGQKRDTWSSSIQMLRVVYMDQVRRYLVLLFA